MSKSYNQKMKILYIMKILLDETDENHVFAMSEIISKLECLGIKAERKSIYDDMEALRLFGVDIINRREQPAGYYIASRQFELPELKLLVDAVQASKFITYKKSRELIKKIESLSSRSEAQQLQRQVFVSNRVKTMNESIYYNVDKIHTAISADTKISFQYYEWSVTKEMQIKKNGQKYVISPWALSWDDENYYMIGFDEEVSMIKHYRVDKMLNIDLLNDLRVGRELFNNFDTASYTQRTFGMFGGQEVDVDILFKNKFIGVVIDRFGKDVTIRKQDEEHFVAKVKVVVSNQFFGWLTGLGKGVKINAPKSVVTDFQRFLEQVISQYMNSKV